jgi:signal transduction histidine kinase
MGLTVYEGRVSEHRIQVFGVVGPQHRDDLPKHVDFKHACKGRSVTAQEFSSWLSTLKAFEEKVQAEQKRQLAEALEPLHDAMRLARDVEQLAEQELLEANPDAVDRFASASANQRALVKTASLLVDTFDLLEIYLNPQAAAFGQPRKVEIYKLLDKLAKIASLARRQEQRPVVRLQGNTRRTFDVYESFKLIPLTLIDNAQKYSRKGSQVDVKVEEVPEGVQIAVMSEGALLSIDEKVQIFNRGFRGEAALKAHPSGMGLGLYVAQTVALAHGLKISVTSKALGFEISDIQQALNTFSFTVKNVARRGIAR